QPAQQGIDGALGGGGDRAPPQPLQNLVPVTGAPVQHQQNAVFQRAAPKLAAPILNVHAGLPFCRVLLWYRYIVPHSTMRVKALPGKAPRQKQKAPAPGGAGGAGGKTPALFVLFAGGLHAQVMVQNALADAQVLRGDLQQFVGGQKLQAGLQAQLGHRGQAQRVVAAGSAGVGQVLGFADVDGDVVAGGGVAHDLALIDLLAGHDQQGAALLGVEQAVGDGGAGVKADQRAGGPGGDVALP